MNYKNVGCVGLVGVTLLGNWLELSHGECPEPHAHEEVIPIVRLWNPDFTLASSGTMNSDYDLLPIRYPASGTAGDDFTLWEI